MLLGFSFMLLMLFWWLQGLCGVSVSVEVGQCLCVDVMFVLYVVVLVGMGISLFIVLIVQEDLCVGCLICVLLVWYVGQWCYFVLYLYVCVFVFKV